MQVYLDGEPAGRGTALQLSNVDRGSHELRAEIVDQDGRTLISSPTIRFTLHRPQQAAALRPRCTDCRVAHAQAPGQE